MSRIDLVISGKLIKLFKGFEQLGSVAAGKVGSAAGVLEKRIARKSASPQQKHSPPSEWPGVSRTSKVSPPTAIASPSLIYSVPFGGL